MTDVIVVGGTGATSQAFPLYAPLLNSVPSEVPARDRFFPLPHKGLGHIYDTYYTLTEQVAKFAFDRDDFPIIVGHSQGGVHAAMLGLDGLASAVVSLASPHGGIKSLRALEDMSPVAADLDSRNEFVTKHNHDLVNRWPSAVPFHMVNATVDQFVPRQFRVPGVTQWWDAPWWLPRCLMRIPKGVKLLRNHWPSEHITLPYSSGVKWLVNKLSLEADLSSVEGFSEIVRNMS